MAKTMKTLAAADARSLDQVCSLQRDNWSTPDYWLLTDGREVTLAKQGSGLDCEQRVNIPRGEFNRLVRAYLKPQRVRAPRS